MKEGANEGVGRAGVENGGPAGVVEMLEAKVCDVFPSPLDRRARESGVEGGLDEKGTVKADMLRGGVEFTFRTFD